MDENNNEALRTVVEEEGEYEMYLGSYANEIVGLPYNIPFRFRLKKGSSQWERNKS